MTRKATIRTTHDDAERLARALAPDNTDEMETSVERREDGTRAVVTRIERETTGSLHSTVDDYVVNLDVARSIAERTSGSIDSQKTNRRRDSSADADGASPPATNSDTDTKHEPNTQ
ncbi:KEOPS complex subunit Pcc1 [Halostagnicola sp. A-GB9-2]|uniref:KEOPS complex subunit Pcc1 n=1 Tax=Halostagnicola sp. A-GB9-2 TaxID=3048066 RepID=UPI0024C07A3D|nr:KEOPS complex subunit Pcc1 [Halostagnicola sp. A-GB9-2]MDJ1430680.1 KEOPS complex subunit Pcc1 [Halostagnicola sp. A-GB9-2]